MIINNVTIHNIGPFESLHIQFNAHMTIFVGNNGAGKTSILKSVATSLSWFVARILSEKGSGSPIPEGVILNHAPSGAIEITVNKNVVDRLLEQSRFHWVLAKSQKGKKGQYHTQLQGLSDLVSSYRTALTENPDTCSLPLIAYYPVERVVLDVPLKIKEKHSFRQLDGYDNALSQGLDFRRFFEWFREREDAENETGISQAELDRLEVIVDKTVWEKLHELAASSRDRQLTAVRTAVHNAMPSFTHLRVRRKPRLHMTIDKGGKTLNILQLSQGEKSLIALVGDIARRLAMMNPGLENPLEGFGVVLIDEIDMHLHPQWQRGIVTQLRSTFPNCQFILTTHSPLVISDCKDILVYTLENGEISEVPTQYGQDANTVLIDVMNTAIRNKDIETKIRDILDLIHQKNFSEAKDKLQKLTQEWPTDNIELAKIRLLLLKEATKEDFL